MKVALSKKKDSVEDLFSGIMKDIETQIKPEMQTSDGKLTMSTLNDQIQNFKSNGNMLGVVDKISKKLAEGECSEQEILSHAGKLFAQVKSEAGDDPQMSGIFNMINGLLSSAGLAEQI